MRHEGDVRATLEGALEGDASASTMEKRVRYPLQALWRSSLGCVGAVVGACLVFVGSRASCQGAYPYAYTRA